MGRVVTKMQSAFSPSEETTASLAAALAAKMNFPRACDPDLFLRAVFLRTFGSERA